MADSEIDPNSIQKYLLHEIYTITNFLLFRMKYIIDGFFFICILMHIITLLSQNRNEIIHLFITSLFMLFLFIN